MERWQKELANGIRTTEQLAKKIKLSPVEIVGAQKATEKFRMFITPYYLGLIDKNNLDCPIRKQTIPSVKELKIREEELRDPLGDERKSPVKGITHRYPDRVLFYLTYQCASYCRHCFRRRIVGQRDKALTPKEIKKAIDYIKKHSQIKEVILTGGDPLFLPDAILENILRKLKQIKHVKWLRIHTRTFVNLPYRFTPKLIKILKSARPLYVVTHVNHPKEITPQFKHAVDRAQNAGIIVLNQGVLLKGINDDVEILKELFYGLLEAGVKPYYLHQCDLATGIGHFRTSVGKGIRLLRQLRGFISGLAIPFYMIDTPGGYGKVPVDYNYMKSYKNKIVELETFKGEIKEYKEP